MSGFLVFVTTLPLAVVPVDDAHAVDMALDRLAARHHAVLRALVDRQVPREEPGAAVVIGNKRAVPVRAETRAGSPGSSRGVK